MKIKEFKYEKETGIEDKKVVVIIRENSKYIEGYEIGDDITEEMIQKINTRYRKFKRDKIKSNIDKPDNIELLKHLEKNIEYYTVFDLSNCSKQVQDQVKNEINRIYNTIQNLSVLLNNVNHNRFIN